jgi:hypothetical protein
MNSTKKLSSVALLAGSALVTQCAYGAESSVTLDVPFAFVVAGRTLPAGAYTVETNGTVISVHGRKTSVLVGSGPTAMMRNAQPALIFTRRGATAYLTGVHTEDDTRSIGLGQFSVR